jgi:hypothetical protein
MNRDAAELARKLVGIQTQLRNELFDELLTHEGELDAVFDPYSYSPLVHELREKYLTRLYLIHGIIQQLAQLSKGRAKHATRVLSVSAENQERLVEQVNHQLVRLNGNKVLDVKFVSGNGDHSWAALITYEVNPFMEEADETAAWM